MNYNRTIVLSSESRERNELENYTELCVYIKVFYGEMLYHLNLIRFPCYPMNIGLQHTFASIAIFVGK